LQLNLPNTSCRDLVIHGNDLVLGTYGRGIWVLDDISALRQLMAPGVASEPVHLFAPGEAVRVRRNVGNDTPFPPEVPHALNPPDGAIIYYSLATKPAGAMTIDVLDAAGTVVRRMTSGAVEPVKEAARPPEPNFWIAPPQALPAAAGINRTNWDLRYDPPPAFTHSFEINANPGLTPASPEGPMVRPGTYTIRLTVEGQAYTSTVTVTADPRGRATPAQLTAQADLQLNVYRMIGAAWDGFHQADALRSSLAPDTTADASARALIARIDSVAGRAPTGAPQFGQRGPAGPNFVAVHRALVGQLNGQDLADQAPTAAAVAAYQASCKDMKSAVTTWNAIRESVQSRPGVTLTGQALAAPVCAAPRTATGR
jgi:hypothetical protein